MDLEICRFTDTDQSEFAERRAMTDYAGKSSTLNAVATTAHCAIDGCISAIEASHVSIHKYCLPLVNRVREIES